MKLHYSHTPAAMLEKPKRAKRRTKEEIASAKREKEERRAAREKRRLDTQLEKAALLQECTTLPPEYQAWDFVRTHAWRTVVPKMQTLARSKYATLEKVQIARASLRDVITGSLESVSQLIYGEKAK